MAGYRDNYFEKNSSNYGWYECNKCGKKLRKGDADIDHIFPQKYGGVHNEINLQCLCRSCNRSKQADLDDVVPDYVDSAKRIGKRTISNFFK